MEFEINMKCPYCGTGQHRTIKGRRNSEVVVCVGDNIADENCGKEYVLRWRADVTLTVHAIDGEDTKKQAALGGDQC